jgi:hypothetical protein
MVPLVVNWLILIVLRRRFLKSHGVHRPEDFEPDVHGLLLADLEEDVARSIPLGAFFVLSLLLVYPALIGNCIFHVDELRPWFVFVCCVCVYTPIAYLWF